MYIILYTYISTTGSSCDSSEVPLMSLLKLELATASTSSSNTRFTDVATAILAVELNNVSADSFIIAMLWLVIN